MFTIQINAHVFLKQRLFNIYFRLVEGERTFLS